MDDESFRKILQCLSLSWQGYRRVRKGVKKRVARHMQELGCSTAEHYLELLQRQPGQMRKARELLSVSVSRFFRDIPLWEAIGAHVLPRLVRSGSRTIRIWSAGCACGEEAYSLKILWSRFIAAQRPALFLSESGAGRVAFRGAGTPAAMSADAGIHPTFQESNQTVGVRLDTLSLVIVATDINPEVLEKARAGIFTASSIKNLDKDLRESCFNHVGDRFSLRDHLKSGIRWICHDLVLDDPPGLGFDSIFLRNNLLTYYDEKIVLPALARVVSALRQGGFLIVGKDENVPISETRIKRCSMHASIYSRK
ncbi:MAG: hypothetical protein HPY84_12015 [Syntrophobacteraceae bacterium]|nr:hypothetical protein [Syntrophobacteraceae bacterium]